MTLGVALLGYTISSVSPPPSSLNIHDLILSTFTAIVTHKGAAADAGHYIGFVKKRVFHNNKSPFSAEGAAAAPAPPAPSVDEDDEDWYKFDDDKVSDFPKEKLATLDGGGTPSMILCLRMLSCMGH